VVTNTVGTTANTDHRYYTFADPLNPVCTVTNVVLGPSASAVYTVGLVPCLPSIFYGRLEIVSDQPVQAEVLSPHKLIMGTVQYPDGNPVTDARVIAHRDGAPDHIEVRVMTGTYRIPVDDGRWLLDLAPAWGVTSTDWIYADPPQVAEFTLPPEQREMRIVNFQVLTTTGHLIGRVRLPWPPGGTLGGLGVRVVARNSIGIGNDVWTDPAGDFDLRVPEGVYNVYVRPDTPILAGPRFNGVLITTTTDIGVIHLLTTTVVITGQVTDGAGNDLNTIPGVTDPARVIAWERHGAGWGAINTDPQGFYTLPLAMGPIFSDWMMRVEPPLVAPPNPPLVPPLARRIILRAGMHLVVNFRLLPADGRIIGQVVDTGENHLDLLGRAHALRHPRDHWPRHFDAPMYSGYFTLTVPTTHTYNFIYDVSVRPDPAFGYAPGYVRNVDPPTSGDVAITVTLHQRDARIAGALVDATQLPTVTHIVTGVKARVFAINRPPAALEGDWQSRWINPLTGQYHMGVVSDTWRMNFRVKHPQRAGWIPHPRFRHDPAWHLHHVDSGDTITVPLPVLPLDRVITGVVKLGSMTGPPVPYVKVCGRGIDLNNRGIEVCTETGRLGRYLLRTTSGHYWVRVILPQTLRDRGFIEPDAEIANPTEGDVDFVVRRANATVRGQAIISTTDTITRPTVLVWGWSMGGSHVYTKVALPEIGTTGTFTPEASYAISVTGSITGDVWHFGAAYESGGIIYRCPRQRVEVHAGDTIPLNLLLASVEELLGRLPEPTSVTFDRSLGIILELDGVTIRIPASAIPADTDDVTIDIYPLGMAPEQRFEEVIGFSYAMAAYDADGNQVTERFYENVAVTMSYSETLLALLGIDEEDILPAYLSTTTGRWTAPESYVVDITNDEVTLYIDHFTEFGLLGAPSIESKIYLPLVMRSFGG